MSYQMKRLPAAPGKTAPMQTVRGSGTPIQGALGKVNRFAAFATGVVPAEFVREDLFALTALGALAVKGFEVVESVITGAMLGCRHDGLLAV